MEKVLSDKQGKALLQIARQTIADRLGITVLSENAQVALPDIQYGTFVTLKNKGQLRGCIGNLQASESVTEGVKRNAISAAFHDSRFSALTVDELEEIEIDISVLSRAQVLDYDNAQDLIAKLRPGIDGVIVTVGTARATFLPQVWDQLPTVEQFLGHLCRKAGLVESAWKSSHPQIETYQVQCFEEEEV